MSGGHIASIYNACPDYGINLVDVRHEQAAAHAAAGWARITGEPGFCLVTAGPGVTDTVTGVAEAMMADCPMIVFGGRSPLYRNDTGPLQDLDQLAFMAPLTKWARAVYQAERLPEYVAMAFRKAKSPVPSPVYLECAVDVLDQEVDGEKVFFPENYYTKAEPYGDPKLVRQAADMLMNAERPVIIAGDGLFWTGGGSVYSIMLRKCSILQLNSSNTLHTHQEKSKSFLVQRLLII